MKQSSILLGLVLAVGAFAADPPAAANPLDGKVFQSVEKLTGGERRDGSVTKTHWTIRFKERSFEWRYTDVVSRGTYEFDAKTGALTIKDSKVKASYDAKTGELTWDGRKYKAVPGGK